MLSEFEAVSRALAAPASPTTAAVTKEIRESVLTITTSAPAERPSGIERPSGSPVPGFGEAAEDFAAGVSRSN
jgi:hypothetical protein